MEVWSAPRPGSFNPRARVPGTHWIGRWVGTVSKRKIPSPCRDSNPDHPIVQSVVSRYTGYDYNILIAKEEKSAKLEVFTAKF
jgi:hypothetical protein